MIESNTLKPTKTFETDKYHAVNRSKQNKKKNEWKIKYHYESRYIHPMRNNPTKCSHKVNETNDSRCKINAKRRKQKEKQLKKNNTSGKKQSHTDNTMMLNEFAKRRKKKGRV